MKIAVLGGCNVDFICKAKSEIEAADSNAATITMHPGGVGRNIAENLANLGCSVTLVTSVGDDVYARFIEKNLSEINVKGALIRKNQTGIYFAIIKTNGLMDTAFCDLTTLESVTFDDILATNIEFNKLDGVIIDANFQPAVIAKMADFCSSLAIPYALEPVSNHKAPRIKQAIKGATLIKPNRYEAQTLTGNKCLTIKDAQICAETFYKMGAKNVLLSLGADGFYFYSEKFHDHFLPKEIKITNETGAGDALFASAFISILKGHNPQKTAAIAGHAAAMTCSVHTSVCNALTSAIFDMEE